MMYRGVLIAERANGTFDIILPHRWLNRPTLRAAKWWVSVYQFILGEPSEHKANPEVLLMPHVSTRQGHEPRQLAS